MYLAKMLILSMKQVLKDKNGRKKVIIYDDFADVRELK